MVGDRFGITVIQQPPGTPNDHHYHLEDESGGSIKGELTWQYEHHPEPVHVKAGDIIFAPEGSVAPHRADRHGDDDPDRLHADRRVPPLRSRGLQAAATAVSKERRNRAIRQARQGRHHRRRLGRPDPRPLLQERPVRRRRRLGRHGPRQGRRGRREGSACREASSTTTRRCSPSTSSTPSRSAPSTRATAQPTDRLPEGRQARPAREADGGRPRGRHRRSCGPGRSTRTAS